MNEDARFGLDKSGSCSGPYFDSGRWRRLAYETYSSSMRMPATHPDLPCALTGDQYVASKHPLTGKDGWWGADGGSRSTPIADICAKCHRQLSRQLGRRR
jgi:hypothetical protein